MIKANPKRERVLFLKTGILLAVFVLSFSMVHDPACGAETDLWSEVSELRQERTEKMPYLDTSFIDSEINPEKISQTMDFLKGPPKTLNKVLDRAAQVYTPARASRERISLAQRRILAALRALFPEASYEFSDKDGLLSIDKFNHQDYKFKFRQPLFRGGVLWNTLLQEKAGLESAEREYAARVNDLINEVSAAYFEYERTLKVVTSQAAAIEQMEKYAGMSKRKLKENIVSQIENLNAQSIFSQMTYDYETSKQELELAKLDLQRYLDLDFEAPLEIVSLYKIEDLLKDAGEDSGEAGNADYDPFGKSAKPMPTLAELVDLSYQHRPELQVESSKLESARLEERIRHGKLMPTADVVLEFGKMGEAFDNIEVNPGLRREFRLMLEFNWNFAGNKVNYTFENSESAPSVSQFQGSTGSQTTRNTIAVGILDGLEDFAQVKEAEVSRLDQISELEKTEKETVQDVKQSFYDYQKAKIQMKSSIQRADYRRRLAMLSKHRLEKNEIQISEYMQAEIDLLQEQATLHKAVADYYTAKAKLNHAIGLSHYFPIEGLNGSQSDK